MAVIERASTDVGNQIFHFDTVTASDSTDPIFLDAGHGFLVNCSTVGGGGTGYNSGTITIQVSNDNTNWATLKDVHGTDAAFTAAGMFELSTGAQYIRLLADGSIGDVDVIISFG